MTPTALRIMDGLLFSELFCHSTLPRFSLGVTFCLSLSRCATRGLCLSKKQWYWLRSAGLASQFRQCFSGGFSQRARRIMNAKVLWLATHRQYLPDEHYQSAYHSHRVPQRKSFLCQQT